MDEFTVQAPAFLPSELQGQWPLVLLAVKAHHTQAAAESLLPHLAADGMVVSFQNGLNELEIAAVVGKERTMGAFINYGSGYQSPGTSPAAPRAACMSLRGAWGRGRGGR